MNAAPVSVLTEPVARTSEQEPQWLTSARHEAITWVGEHGYPTRKDEDWRYTKLDALWDVPFTEAGSTEESALPDDLEARIPDLGGTRLVFVDGTYSEEQSRKVFLPDGVIVTNLASILAEQPERLDATRMAPFATYHHAFQALNAGLTAEGVFIELPTDVQVVDPIHLVFYSTGSADPLLINPRTIVFAGARSQATIVESYLGVEGGVSCTNSVIEMVLDEDAHIDHDKLQDDALSAYHFSLLDVVQGPRSRFTSRLVSLGAAIARNEVHVRLEGDGAQVDLDGLYLPRGDQQHDNPVLVEHSALGCRSTQLYKGALADRSHGVFNGRIIVHPGAHGTEAHQTNKNLLLSNRAEADTRPRLEIFDDDVICTHGAAVGQLDETSMFYLQSRGIGVDDARDILTYAFIAEMVDRVDLPELQARVKSLVVKRFNADQIGG